MWGPVCEIEDYCSEVNWHIMTIENCAMGSSLMFVTRPASQLATMGFSEHKVETYWLLMLCCHSLSDIHC